MVELVDTRDLKSLDHCGRTGASPVPGTKVKRLADTTLQAFFYKKRRICNYLGIKWLFGLLENWVTRQQPFVFQSSSLLCFNVITLDATKEQKEMQTKRE